jgi:hypothetical protein
MVVNFNQPIFIDHLKQRLLVIIGWLVRQIVIRFNWLIPIIIIPVVRANTLAKRITKPQVMFMSPLFKPVIMVVLITLNLLNTLEILTNSLTIIPVIRPITQLILVNRLEWLMFIVPVKSPWLPMSLILQVLTLMILVRPIRHYLPLMIQSYKLGKIMAIILIKSKRMVHRIKRQCYFNLMFVKLLMVILRVDTLGSLIPRILVQLMVTLILQASI